MRRGREESTRFHGKAARFPRREDRGVITCHPERRRPLPLGEGGGEGCVSATTQPSPDRCRGRPLPEGEAICSQPARKRHPLPLGEGGGEGCVSATTQPSPDRCRGRPL